MSDGKHYLREVNEKCRTYCSTGGLRSVGHTVQRVDISGFLFKSMNVSKENFQVNGIIIVTSNHNYYIEAI